MGRTLQEIERSTPRYKSGDLSTTWSRGVTWCLDGDPATRVSPSIQ